MSDLVTGVITDHLDVDGGPHPGPPGPTPTLIHNRTCHHIFDCCKDLLKSSPVYKHCGTEQGCQARQSSTEHGPGCSGWV